MVNKVEDAINFLKIKNNGIELLGEYLHDPPSMPKDILRIQVSSLTNTYK